MIPWFYHSMNVLHFTLLAHIGGRRFSFICGKESISRTAVKTHFSHHLLSLVKATLGWDSKQVERIRSRGPHHSDVGLLWGRRFFSSPSINSTHHGACMFSQVVAKRLPPPGWERTFLEHFLFTEQLGPSVHEAGAALRVDRGSSLLGMCRAIKAAGSLFPLAKWLYLHSPTQGMCRHQRNGFFFLIKVLLLLGPVIRWYV